MNISVIDGNEKFVCNVSEESTVFEALLAHRKFIDAPCGGNGTCGKCRVLVHDETGTSYRLACRTEVAEGMEVIIEGARPMEVSKSGNRCTWEPDSSSGYGVAIDVGTTTVVSRLIDCSSGAIVGVYGSSNPQISFGADIISRISACMNGSLEDMQVVLGDALFCMINNLCRDAGIKLNEVTHIALAGNTTMEYIAAGIDPTPIGKMPFVPSTLFGYEVGIFEELPLVYFAPCIAGYVGGDIVAGILAVNMAEREKPVLLLDLGTNGEMALGDKNGIVACATAAGPVFEGGNIAFGMPAYPGAICQVSYTDERLSISTIGDKEPVGICGTGLIDAVSTMLTQGVVDETGYLLNRSEAPKHMACYIDKLNGETAFRLAEGVYVTQRDLRNLQLAKAAICAGIRTALDHAEMTASQVDEVLIAGGFGENLNLDSAITVGLFPPEMRHCAKSVGNTAIEGVTAMLASGAARKKASEILETCQYLELSMHAGFNGYYVNEMVFMEA